MRYLAIGLLGMVSACSNSSNGAADAPRALDGAIDAPHTVDAPHTIDAPADATHVPGAHHHYVVSSEHIPTSNGDAQANGLDLDGDGSIDNQFGQAMAALSTEGFDLQGPTTTAIANGTILQLADVQGDSLTAGAGGFTLFGGADPVPTPCASGTDTTCGRQLTGSGSFTIAPDSPQDAELAGTITGGVLVAGAGHLGLQTAELGTPTITLGLIGARVRLSPTTDGITSGIVAGGITMTDVTTKIYPQFATGMQTLVATDCTALASPPTCGCTSGSAGAEIVALFDGDDGTTKDCHISTAEIAASSLITTLLMPDVTLEGQPALSTGIGFTAVDATYTQP